MEPNRLQEDLKLVNNIEKLQRKSTLLAQENNSIPELKEGEEEEKTLDDNKGNTDKPSGSENENSDANNNDKADQVSELANENTIPAEKGKSLEDHERKESLELKQEAAGSDNSDSDSDGGEDDQETLSKGTIN